MANMIEPTPTLSGKDAERFYESIEKAEFDPKKKELIEEARELYRSIEPRWKSFPSHITR